MSTDPFHAPSQAVAELVRRQHEVVGTALDELVRNPATDLPALLGRLRAEAGELNELAARANSAVGPVRDRLTAASGRVRSAHAEAVDCARRFCEVAATTPADGLALGGEAVLLWLPYVPGGRGAAFRAAPSLDHTLVQHWLAGVGLEVGKLLGGSDRTLGSGVAFEAERAAVLWRAEQPQRAGNAIRREGEIWHLTFEGETGDYPTSNGLEWLAKLLGRPNQPLTVAELRGDPEGKLAGDARLRGERQIDDAGIAVIRRKVEDIEEIGSATGWTEELEKEKTELLRELKAADEQTKNPLKAAHHTIATGLRRLARERLPKDMPRLAAHLGATLNLDFPHFRYSPPTGMPAWDV